MSFFDDLKQRFFPQPEQDYYEDGYEDEYEASDGLDSSRSRLSRRRGGGSSRASQHRSGLLGNSSRPEAQSVSVFTRNGKRLSSQGTQSDFATGDAAAFSDAYAAGDYADSSYTSQNYVPASYDTQGFSSAQDENFTPSFDDEGKAASAYDSEPAVSSDDAAPSASLRPIPVREPSSVSLTPSMSSQYAQSPKQSLEEATTVAQAPALGDRSAMRATSQLPPYVLKPRSYADAEKVVRRVMTGQPVILALATTNIEAAKRVLDFSYGLATGIGGSVEEVADRSFVVLPAGAKLGRSYLDKLISDGTLRS